MLLATHIATALTAEIAGQLAQGGTFPLDVRLRSFSFRVSQDRIDGEPLLAVLTVEGQDFLVYHSRNPSDLMAEILARLIEPAALIGWLLGAIVAIAWRRGWKLLLASTALGLGAYLALSTPLGANLLLHTVESRADSLRDCRYGFDGRVLVVLGGGMEIDGVPRVDPSRLSRTTLRRLMVAANIARTGQVSRVVVSGQGAVVREADLMRDALVELGLSPATILVDSSSDDTFEQARNVARLLDRDGARPHRVGLVTSAAHMSRAYSLFGAENFEVCPIVAEWRSARPPVRLALIPHVSALDKSTEALRELGANIGTLLRGRS